VKAALHGAERTRRRVELNNRVAKIEECVKKGQTGSAIRYALGPKNRGFDLSSLRIDEEEVTDQDEINRAATDHMKMWFDEKPAPFDGCLGGVGAKWRDVFAPEEDFLHRTAGSGIPHSLRSHMWKHFQKKDIDRTAMSDFSSLMAEPPSLDEWLSRVKGLPKKSAPGPSGLTYDMIQCWPVEIHRAVLDAHIELWHKGLSPGSWSRKWLVLIPKGAGATLDDFRPLMLIEALRKVWSGIFLGRIQCFLETNRVLHPSQHGASRGAGTDTAAPIFINALETAREWGSSIFISSWDVKRAFDSISREYQIAALVRVGIPVDTAEYLVNLDGGGEVAVRSPLNETSNLDIGGWDNVREDGYMFRAGRGTGQGDPLSPLIFACCLDPLVCALADISDGSFFVQSLDQVSTVVPDIAYVDDAVSVTGTFEALQKKADVMSAFASLINIELSLKKLRTFAVQWGNPNRPDHDQLVVHIATGSSGWSPIEVPLKSTGEFTHLGVAYNMNLCGPELYDRASAMIDDLGTKVAISRM